VNLESVQSGSHRWVTFSKLAGLLLAINFENAEPESATSCHDWPVQQKLASRKLS